MSLVDILIKQNATTTIRGRQIASMFDVPVDEDTKLKWRGDVPIDDDDWQIGLIVGASGSGKTTVARKLFPDFEKVAFEWDPALSVVENIKDKSLDEITKTFSSVGFNTIPAWLRPFHVLSNGERFRVEIARRLLENNNNKIIVVDEFTSVVDRQTAQIASHAIQKNIRKNKKKFVAISCHYDIVDWLQPDWILEPATMSFQRRSLRRRPKLEFEIQRVDYSAWKLFAPFHYMSASLNKTAVCFVLFVNGNPAAFIGVLHFPHPKKKNLKRNSRTVVLPDYQGLGLAFIFMEKLASAYKALGFEFRSYPAHLSFIRGFKKEQWKLEKKPGRFGDAVQIAHSTIAKGIRSGFGGRPNAVFSYRGKAMQDKEAARKLIHD